MKNILTMAREAGFYTHQLDEDDGILVELQRFADLIRADAVPPGYVVAPMDWTHAAREKAGYEEGWKDCMNLWADHMKRMNAALIDRPSQATYKVKMLEAVPKEETK